VLQAAYADGFKRLCVIQKLSGAAGMTDIGDEKITLQERGLIGADDGEPSGHIFHIGRIEGTVESGREMDGTFGGVIGKEHGEAQAGMRFLEFKDGAGGHEIERAVMADEEFGDAVLLGMDSDRLQEGRVYGFGRIAVTDEEADGHMKNTAFYGNNSRFDSGTPHQPLSATASPHGEAYDGEYSC